MNRRVEIIVDGGYNLDIDENIGIGLTYQLDDIRNPEDRNNAYSKTVVLPGSKNNNKILGFLFDVNETFDILNPNFRTTCRVVSNGTLVMNGYLQLLEVNKS